MVLVPAFQCAWQQLFSGTVFMLDTRICASLGKMEVPLVFLITFLIEVAMQTSFLEVYHVWNSSL